jgi:hypothetical protein
MARRGGSLLLSMMLALLAGTPTWGQVTADLVLSLRHWQTDVRNKTTLDNVRLLADARLDQAWGLHLDYDRETDAEEELAEAYAEWNSGRQRVRLGRFQVPFGIYNRSELYYVGLVNPPILKGYLGGEYQVGRSEHGLGSLLASGRWQLEAGLFAERGGWRAVVPSGGEGSLRLQYYANSLILGLSGLCQQGIDPESGVDGTARFVGLDFRFSRPSLILRGELVSGTAPGGYPRGFYLDVLYRPAALRVVTLVGRVESARGLSGESSYWRETVGFKWELGRGTALAVNQAFDSPRSQYGFHGTTVYLWHFRRL